MTPTDIILIILVAAILVLAIIGWRLARAINPPMPKSLRGLQPMMGDYIRPRPLNVKADRIVLPLSSTDPADLKAREVDRSGKYKNTAPKMLSVRPGEMMEITARPQNIAFRPEKIVIGGKPDRWLVHDIKVGNRSQFSQRGEVPGEVFSHDAMDAFVSFDTVQTAMDMSIIVSYIGPEKEGEPFYAAAIGSAAMSLYGVAGVSPFTSDLDAAWMAATGTPTTEPIAS